MRAAIVNFELCEEAFEADGDEWRAVQMRPGRTESRSKGSSLRLEAMRKERPLDWFCPGLHGEASSRGLLPEHEVS